MGKQECKSFLQILSDLQITNIECYFYPEVPDIKHVFFYFDGGKRCRSLFHVRKEKFYILNLFDCL